MARRTKSIRSPIRSSHRQRSRHRRFSRPGTTNLRAVPYWSFSDSNGEGYQQVSYATNTEQWGYSISTAVRRIVVGNVTQFMLKNVNIDDFAFGVSAIGGDGSESLVSSYVSPVRQGTTIKRQQ